MLRYSIPETSSILGENPETTRRRVRNNTLGTNSKGRPGRGGISISHDELMKCIKGIDEDDYKNGRDKKRYSFIKVDIEKKTDDLTTLLKKIRIEKELSDDEVRGIDEYAQLAAMIRQELDEMINEIDIKSQQLKFFELQYNIEKDAVTHLNVKKCSVEQKKALKKINNSVMSSSVATFLTMPPFGENISRKMGKGDIFPDKTMKRIKGK